MSVEGREEKHKKRAKEREKEWRKAVEQKVMVAEMDGYTSKGSREV